MHNLYFCNLRQGHEKKKVVCVPLLPLDNKIYLIRQS